MINVKCPIPLTPSLSPPGRGSRLRLAQSQLQRERAFERALVHLAALAAVDDRTPLHDRKMIAELAGEVEILLDQHDRDPAEIAQVGNGTADVLDDRGLDAFGGLVEQQEP